MQQFLIHKTFENLLPKLIFQYTYFSFILETLNLKCMFLGNHSQYFKYIRIYQLTKQLQCKKKNASYMQKMRRQIPHPTPHHSRFSACMYIRYALVYLPRYIQCFILGHSWSNMAKQNFHFHSSIELTFSGSVIFIF